jgi:hypothetical protein
MRRIEFGSWGLCVPQGVTHLKIAPRFIDPFMITVEGEEELKVKFSESFSDPSES